MATPSTFTKEDVNFIRLKLLVSKIGTAGLREFFDNHPQLKPISLQSTLTNTCNYKKLETLRNNGKISAIQWNLLFPTTTPSSVPTSNDFDVTLLVLLLRSCGGFCPPWSFNWDELPAPDDKDDYHDIARLKHYRNKYAHASSSISDGDFLKDWKDLEEAILRIVPKPSVTQYTAEIKDLLTKPMSQDCLAYSLNQLRKCSTSSKSEASMYTTYIINKLEAHLKEFKDKLDSSGLNSQAQIKASSTGVESKLSKCTDDVIATVRLSDIDVKGKIGKSEADVKMKIATSNSSIKETFEAIETHTMEKMSTLMREVGINANFDSEQKVPEANMNEMITLLSRKLKRAYKERFRKNRSLSHDSVPSLFDVSARLYMDLDYTLLDMRCTKTEENQTFNSKERPETFQDSVINLTKEFTVQPSKTSNHANFNVDASNIGTDAKTAKNVQDTNKCAQKPTTANITDLLNINTYPEMLPILIEAEAGVGKTTLLRRLVLNWTDGLKNLEKFKLVFYIPLRSVRSNNIEDIICDDLKLLRPEHKENLKRCIDLYEDEILFLLDGLDEVKLGEECGLQKLIYGAGRHVLFSSRPSPNNKSVDLSNTLSVRLLGFSNETVDKFINLYFNTVDDSSRKPAVAESFLAECRKHFFCKSLMKIPLYARILCYLWDKETEKLPDSATQLFNKFLMEILNSYLERYDAEGKCNNRLHQIESGKVTFLRSPLEQSVPPAIRRLLISIAELAYKTLVQGHVVFSLEIVSECDLSVNDITDIGLFTVEEEGSVIYFRHKLFHEYFAGLYLTIQENEFLILSEEWHMSLTRFHVLQNAFVFAAGLSEDLFQQMVYLFGARTTKKESLKDLRHESKSWRSESLDCKIKNPLTTSFYLRLYFEHSNNARNQDCPLPDITTIPVNLASVHSLAAALYVLKMQKKEQSSPSAPWSLLLIGGPILDVEQVIAILEECNRRPDITHIRFQNAGKELLNEVMNLTWGYIQGIGFVECNYFIQFDHLVTSFPRVKNVFYDDLTWENGKVFLADGEIGLPDSTTHKVVLFVKTNTYIERTPSCLNVNFYNGSDNRCMIIGWPGRYQRPKNPDWSFGREDCLSKGIINICIENEAFDESKGCILEQCIKQISYLKSTSAKNIVYYNRPTLYLFDGAYLDYDTIKPVLNYYSRYEEVWVLHLNRARQECIDILLSVDWPHVRAVTFIKCAVYLGIKNLSFRFPKLFHVTFDSETQKKGKVMEERHVGQRSQVIMQLAELSYNNGWCDICNEDFPDARCIFVTLTECQDRIFIESLLNGAINVVCTLHTYMKLEEVDQQLMSKLQPKNLTHFHAMYSTRSHDKNCAALCLFNQEYRLSERELQIYVDLLEKNCALLGQDGHKWQSSIVFVFEYHYYVHCNDEPLELDRTLPHGKLSLTYEYIKDLCHKENQYRTVVEEKILPFLKDKYSKKASSRWISKDWERNVFEFEYDDKVILISRICNNSLNASMMFKKEDSIQNYEREKYSTMHLEIKR